jgi:hypothetical protein
VTHFPESAVSVLEIGPDDILVVKVKGSHSGETMARVREHFSNQLPGRNFLVIDDQADLTVLKGSLAKEPGSARGMQGQTGEVAHPWSGTGRAGNGSDM